MIKKIATAAFIVAFGIAMTNVTLANHEGMFCTQQYQPVCGEVQVQCVTAPCYPVQQTFGNRCEAERAHATNIQPGTCDSQSQELRGTSRRLSSFNGAPVISASNTLSFAATRFTAHVCNYKSGVYDTKNGNLYVNSVNSTLMACTSPTSTYEGAFDLSGARYNILGRVLTIDTVGRNRMQRTKTGPVISNSVLVRRYGLVIRQLNQIIKARGYDTFEEKKTYLNDLLNRLNSTNGSYTRHTLIIRHFVRDAVQFYLIHLDDGTLPNN